MGVQLAHTLKHSGGVTTHLGYLSNVGDDRISWATKRHVIKIAKIQVRIQRGEQWLDSVTEHRTEQNFITTSKILMLQNRRVPTGSPCETVFNE